MTKKSTTTPPGKRPQIQASIDPALFERIKAEADANFDSLSGIVETRLSASYANGSAIPKTPFADTKEKSAVVDLEMKEMRLRQLRKDLLTVDEAVRAVEEIFGEMRTEGLALMEDFGRDFGLDPEVLRRRFLATMAGTFQVEREPFKLLAQGFSQEALPR